MSLNPDPILKMFTFANVCYNNYIHLLLPVTSYSHLLNMVESCSFWSQHNWLHNKSYQINQELDTHQFSVKTMRSFHFKILSRKPCFETLVRCHLSLRWRHNGQDSVPNHQPHDCLLNRLFRRRSKKTSELRVTGLCVGNSPWTGEFPAQMASIAENVSIWWRHHGYKMWAVIRTTASPFPHP